jgi:hypothetical protein
VSGTENRASAGGEEGGGEEGEGGGRGVGGGRRCGEGRELVRSAREVGSAGVESFEVLEELEGIGGVLAPTSVDVDFEDARARASFESFPDSLELVTTAPIGTIDVIVSLPLDTVSALFLPGFQALGAIMLVGA